MEKKYIPINCDFYDEIELRALRGSQTTIVFRSEKDEPQTMEGVIHNVFAKNKVEFLEMKSGVKIRLDQLISIDGKPMPNAC